MTTGRIAMLRPIGYKRDGKKNEKKTGGGETEIFTVYIQYCCQTFCFFFSPLSSRPRAGLATV